ncbi:MAG: trehalose-phosphatase [Archangium sp.]|nr:trehalose-phosphatase [Archangium sp.]
MKHLLSRANAGVLAQLAWSNVLLGFDFDGTLSPIVARPERAHMRERTSKLLARVCRLYPCVIISGRSQPDVSARLRGAGVRHVMGNHGLEPGFGLPDFEHEVSRAKPILQRALARWPGVDLEDKRYSLAIHYRRSRQKQKVRAAIAAAVAALPVRMRVVPGKLVVNLVPARAPNKADALLHLRAKEKADTALYVGDDVTDEDVFKLDQPGRLLSVRVGKSSASAAAWFLKDQREIDRLLATLVKLREERRP